MKFLARMRVSVPPLLPETEWQRLKDAEKALALQLQREGVWQHLWRVAGRYENVSVFDVADNDALHTLLSSLPLFPYMDIHVTALAQHPSALAEAEGLPQCPT